MAPIANMMKLEPAAHVRRRLVLRVDAQFLGQVKSSPQRFSSRWISSLALVAVSGLSPMVTNRSTSSACSACGCNAERALLDEHFGVDLLVGRMLTDVNSPNAIENAPATRPAKPLITTVCAIGRRANTRDQCGVADKAVHLAPNVAARNQAAADVPVLVVELVQAATARVSRGSTVNRYIRRFQRH